MALVGDLEYCFGMQVVIRMVYLLRSVLNVFNFQNTLDLYASFFFPIPTVFDFQYKIQLAFGRRKKFKQSDCVVRDGRILKIIFTQPFYVLRKDRIEVHPYILVWFIPISYLSYRFSRQKGRMITLILHFVPKFKAVQALSKPKEMSHQSVTFVTSEAKRLLVSIMCNIFLQVLSYFKKYSNQST